jgi:major membrane immunogen (membrane-anchored lipoprotein)
MKKALISVLSLSVLFVACSKRTANTGNMQEALVGRWWSMAGSQKITMEFAKDGTYKTVMGDQTTNSTYKWLDESTIELNKTQKVKVTVSQDELTMVLGNETSKFEREKSVVPPHEGLSPPSDSGTSGIIKQAVLAKRVSPLISSPVEVTDKFPTIQGSIWAVVTVSKAPAGTKLKAVLATVNASDAANPIPPNTKLGESESTADERSVNLGFHWTYPGAPVGTYKVDLFLNGTLDRTLSFSVTKDATGPSDSATNPQTAGGCPTLQTVKENWPAFLRGITIAQGRDAQGKPLNPGRIFRPDSPAFYAVLTTENAPANTQVGARWFATDISGVEPCNTQFSSYEMVTDGSGNPWFSTTPPVAGSKWPEGLYRLEIYVNGALAHAVDFGVCDGTCKFQVPLAWTLP